MKARLVSLVAIIVTALTWDGLVLAPGAAAGPGTWFPVGPTGGTVFALAIDPSSPTTLYAGLVEAPGGVFKSTDGGATWRESGPDHTERSVWALAIDPSMPATLYAGTEGGIYKSSDGGATWILAIAGFGLPVYGGSSVRALAVDPRPRRRRSTRAGRAASSRARMAPRLGRRPMPV
jgi:hypothetical protein